MSDRLAEIRAHWDRFAPMFQERMEPNTLLLARVLLAQLRLGEAEALLEVGAGAGAAARVAHELLPAGARQVATDLSPEMVARARAALPETVEVQEANAEGLPFPDASFDRLLSNLSLMIVPDTAAALGEAARVLRPGGRAAWSVWGRRAHSPLFTLPDAAARRVGIELPGDKRSNFHLGERDLLREQVAAQGFAGIVSWYQPMVPPFPDGPAYARLVLGTPGWRGFLDTVPAEQAAAMETTLGELAAEVLAAGRPIALEALVVVAEKE